MSFKIAKFISFIFHPILVGAVLLIYLSFFSERLEIIKTFFIFFFDFLFPVFFILFLLKKKIVNNLDISDVKKRKYFYFPVSLFLFLTLPVFYFLKIPRFLFLFQVGFLIWVLLWAIISLFYKISGHVGGASFLYGAIIFLFGENYWPIFLILPILAWSRVKLKQHTIDETVIGAILGFLISFIVFRVLGRI